MGVFYLIQSVEISDAFKKIIQIETRMLTLTVELDMEVLNNEIVSFN